MGKATRLKNEQIALAESAFQEKFAMETRKVKARLAEPIPDVANDFKGFEGFFIRDAKSFSLKTRSNNRDKQRFEFARHVFNLYPVPAFMYNAWELPPTPVQAHYHGTPTRPNYLAFDTKVDYRLWYICIATGGSFYKEYGKAIFTKKECHTFLNCKHDIPISEAIVYAIAFAECENIGKSLRIAKSKLNKFNLGSSYWREVARFFARNKPTSKEQIDDVIDYILSKKQEDQTFTIIGKGHTLESIGHKVEEWHADLRRLKLIGEQNWLGIPVENKEYTYKDSYGNLNVWKFTQIKCARDLQKEGNAMRHCVLSYKQRCIDGVCSIWSVTLNDQRKLTIEVSRGSVAQIRGLANRMARPDEKNVIWQWARDCQFYYSR